MYNSEQYRTWYSKNTDLKLKRVKIRLNNIKFWYKKLKIGKRCKVCKVECTEKFLKRFDFHHKDPETKEFCIADAVGSGLSIKNIEIELEKCEFLCKECHQSLS